MRAVGVHDPGGPAALQVVNLPEPAAGSGQILVRVHAATVNPTDTAMRSGANRSWQEKSGPPPYVPGMDVAGVVEAIGPDTKTDLAVGDRVMAIVVPKGAHGGYSEKLALPADSVVAVPRGASDVEASTLPMNGLTARLALDLMDLKAGQTVAVTGAAGAFGGYVVQLAKADGLRVVADASEADEELVRSLGADIVVRRGDDVAERIRAEVPGGVDGLADGAVQNELVLPAIADGGSMATVRGFSTDEPRGITIHKVFVPSVAEDHERLDRLRQQTEAGEITLRVADTLPFAEAAQAHERLEAGGVRGRLILEF